MERIVIVAKENLISADLIETMLDVSPGQLPKVPHLTVEKEDCSEKTKILRVLEETNYNQKEASKRLGINRSTLYRKLKAYNVSLKRTCNI
jgi:transcriptional regulator of acetoin/glycerol metabolism